MKLNGLWRNWSIESQQITHISYLYCSEQLWNVFKWPDSEVGHLFSCVSGSSFPLISDLVCVSQLLLSCPFQDSQGGSWGETQDVLLKSGAHLRPHASVPFLPSVSSIYPPSPHNVRGQSLSAWQEFAIFPQNLSLLSTREEVEKKEVTIAKKTTDVLLDHKS